MQSDRSQDKNITNIKCMVCARFPAPTGKFSKTGSSEKRHGTLYQCKACGAYFEIVEGSRSYNILSIEEAKQFYDV